MGLNSPAARTTLFVSPRTEGLDLIGLEEPEDEVLEEPEEHLPMHERQRASCHAGGKSLFRRQRQREAVKHEETVGQHDQGQVSIKSLPAPYLIVIKAALLFDSFVQLLHDPAGVGNQNQELKLAACSQPPEY